MSESVTYASFNYCAYVLRISEWSADFLRKMAANSKKYSAVNGYAGKEPTFVTAHTFCASRDTRVSYGRCLLIQGYFCVV